MLKKKAAQYILANDRELQNIPQKPKVLSHAVGQKTCLTCFFGLPEVFLQISVKWDSIWLPSHLRLPKMCLYQLQTFPVKIRKKYSRIDVPTFGNILVFVAAFLLIKSKS